MKDRYLDFLKDQPPLSALKDQYPDLYREAQADLAGWASGSLSHGLQTVIEGSLAHQDRITASGLNLKVIEASFPKIVKARILVLLLKNYNLYARTGTEGRIRFDRFNASVLQRLLFRGSGFERKPVSLFWYTLWWPWLSQKRFLMPLVNKRGIYCFYSRALIGALARILKDKDTLEIAAGDGTLTRFLNGAGATVKATDDRSWNAFVEYPVEVEALDARKALERHAPKAVVCSWPPVGNSFEQRVFECPSVELYVVIGGPDAGNLAAYAAQSAFAEHLDERLSRLVLPREEKNTVRVFTRK
jgi:hypothetical protein